MSGATCLLSRRNELWRERPPTLWCKQQKREAWISITKAKEAGQRAQSFGAQAKKEVRFAQVAVHVCWRAFDDREDSIEEQQVAKQMASRGQRRALCGGLRGSSNFLS